jgi:putative ABC transport system ATP-binding protein
MANHSMNPQSGASDVVIDVKNVGRVYTDGAVKALADVSLQIRRGEYVAIMGPSGSGKSTLLNLLGALDRPTSGEIYFEGEALSGFRDLDGFRAKKIGFVFQSFFLLPTLTALENVQIPMFETSLKASERTAKALKLLEAVGMSHRANHLPLKLSVGERQRVAIARSLANDPSVLLADEPTGNLDSKSGGEILALFDELHRKRGMTLVVITHSQDVGERAERVIWIQDGHVLAAPPPHHAPRAAGAAS